MNRGDDFDGGDLLSLFGFDEPTPASERAEPQTLPPEPAVRKTSVQPRPPPPPPQPATREAPRRRRAFDLRNLSSDELVRSFVLAEVLGPPPSRRGRRRR